MNGLFGGMKTTSITFKLKTIQVHRTWALKVTRTQKDAPTICSPTIVISQITILKVSKSNHISNQLLKHSPMGIERHRLPAGVKSHGTVAPHRLKCTSPPKYAVKICGAEET